MGQSVVSLGVSSPDRLCVVDSENRTVSECPPAPHTHVVFSIDRKTDTAETDKTVFPHAVHAKPGPELQNRVFYIFLPIAETKSLNKAAEQLYVSQPSLTNALKELEKEVGITIFFRTGRGVTLTNDGVEFIAHTMLSTL